MFNLDVIIEDYVVWVGGFIEWVEDECIFIVCKNGNVIFISVNDLFLLSNDSKFEFGD